MDFLQSDARAPGGLAEEQHGPSGFLGSRTPIPSERSGTSTQYESSFPLYELLRQALRGVR